MGEVDLFFHAQIELRPAERSLLEALTAHLAGAMENLRLNALEREAAVAQERTFIARELHDSIAQSLAFLKIQVQLMRDALDSGDEQRVERVLSEIDAGVRESYGDVRELLVHFRTRTNSEDIEPALLTTLRKFEHQTGLKAPMQVQGNGIPLSPDVQVQVLHIVQEALSNVRKHARATRVWMDVQQQPQWRFEVRDDGTGFVDARDTGDETHVGLRIMAERAERIGAALDVLSTPGRGTSVVLTLPLPARARSLRPRRSRTWRRCTEHRVAHARRADSHPGRRRPHAVPARSHCTAGPRRALAGRGRRGGRRRGAAPRAGATAGSHPARQSSPRRRWRRCAAGIARGGPGSAHPHAHRQRGRAGSGGGFARGGANGYLLKTIEGDALVAAVIRAMRGESVVAEEMTGKLVEAYRDAAGAPARSGPAPAEPASPLAHLSPREQEILRAIARGASNKEIGRELGIAETTVKIHVQHVLRKLDVGSRVQAAVIASENGLV